MTNSKVLVFSVLMLFRGIYAFSQTYSKETILITTSYGNMKIKLFEETPLHKKNFLKLIKQGTYDSLLFHRVINNFMIQGGDPDSKRANDTVLLGNGDVGYWIPAEFNPKIYHKKGVLAAAREGDDVNPKKESSGCQFYIVMGKKYDSLALQKAEIRVNREIITKINYLVGFGGKSMKLKTYYNRLYAQGKNDSLNYAVKQLTDSVSKIEYAKTKHYTWTSAQKKTYATLGGTPHLDNNYTIFGEVIEGLDVIDKIAAVKTDKNDRPKENIRMKITILN
ncbi:MAG TPA: peptidylprolyl isomerase [Bacteroidia bacterium]|jgi:peptidylprolyl isomerase|nr:peptidylprolyl isomerase [Bacteroidia bacterium]